MKRVTNARKISENCATDSSDRLRLLALPNSHLVEAVLKEHSHVFTDDCRDRLRNLLQVIVSVNHGHKRKFDRLNDNLNMGPIKNFQERLEDIESGRRDSQSEIKSVQTDNHSYTGPCTSSMVCNVSSSMPENSVDVAETLTPLEGTDEVVATTTEVNTESKSSTKPSGEDCEEEEKNQKNEDDDFYADKKIFAKDELYSTYTKTADAYGLDFINECVRTYSILGAASGDCDSDLEVLYERFADFSKECPREFGDSPLDSKTSPGSKSQPLIPHPSRHLSRRDSSPDSTSTKRCSSKMPGSGVRARNLSAPHEDRKSVAEAHQQQQQRRRNSVPRQDAPALSPIPERRTAQRFRHHHQHHHQTTHATRKRVINVPSLAVRAYVALVMNMQRNCALYKTFRNDLIKPVEYNKQPYITAAYECWMDYMVYMRNTLDYLHPYIMNLVHAYYTRDPNDPELTEYKTKLPKVLINSMKDIKTWNNALNESIECCKRIFQLEPSRSDVHQLYERHYEKLGEVGVHMR